jgi:SAM-dependent methyltransferase
MEDPTMVGTLAAQAEMIWPLERPLLESLGLPERGTVLDLCCGTGEVAGRIARAWPALTVLGIDLFEGHLGVARRAHAGVRNLSFAAGDARATGLPAGSQGAVLLRHVLHALPWPEAVLTEAQRVLRPGGLLYVLAEDYQGLFFDAEDAEHARLFVDVRPALLARGTDLFHGRTAFRQVRAAGFQDVRVHSLVLDPGTVERGTFARMLRYWRDGYDAFLAESLGVPPERVRARFDGLIAAAEDPERYVGWWIPVVAGRAPGPSHR